MVTIQELKKEKLLALKAHDKEKGDILGMLISAYQKAEIAKKGEDKEMSDADMVSILNKNLKELEDEKEMYLKGNRPDEAKTIEKQMAIVKGYLPQMMSEEEIRKVIDGLSDHSMKAIMVAFKKDYAGKADMRSVSQIAKSYQK